MIEFRSEPDPPKSGDNAIEAANAGDEHACHAQ
jgi:hypothetical protein